MSKIKVNDKFVVNGKFSVAAEMHYAVKPPQVVISGALQTVDYFEEIVRLESDRYIVDGVKVTQESFGSEEESICYTFTAGSVAVKRNGGKQDG